MDLHPGNKSRHAVSSTLEKSYTEAMDTSTSSPISLINQAHRNPQNSPSARLSASTYDRLNKIMFSQPFHAQHPLSRIHKNQWLFFNDTKLHHRQGKHWYLGLRCNSSNNTKIIKHAALTLRITIGKRLEKNLSCLMKG